MFLRRGHALIEAVFVFPVLCLMILGFIEMSCWQVDRLLLWQYGQSLVRSLETSNVRTASALTREAQNILGKNHKQHVLAQVEVPPGPSNLPIPPGRIPLQLQPIRLILRTRPKFVTPLSAPLRRQRSDVIQVVIDGLQIHENAL